MTRIRPRATCGSIALVTQVRQSEGSQNSTRKGLSRSASAAEVVVLMGRRAVGRVSPTAGVSPESLAGVALAAMGRAIDEAGACAARAEVRGQRTEVSKG